MQPYPPTLDMGSILDAPFLTTAFLPLVIFALVYVFAYRMRRRIIDRQMGYLDKQTEASERIVTQNKAYEAMIAEQYRTSNEQTERALAQSREALELHAAALRELTAMRETLNAMAARMP